MIDVKELRVGVSLLYDGKVVTISSFDASRKHKELECSVCFPAYLDNGEIWTYEAKWLNNFKPIPLTEDILLKCGAIKSSIDNPFFAHFDFYFDRDRHLSVSNPNTPNEFVMLLEKNKEGKVASVVCISNYDYDGKTYLHQLQNIFYCLSGKELNYTQK